MGEEWTYSHGVDQVDLSERVRVGISVRSNAEEGSVALSTVLVDDPEGELDIIGLHGLYGFETEAPTNQTCFYRGFIADRKVSRGSPPRAFHTGAARIWAVSSADQNSLLSRRIMLGTDANRPAETDVERVEYLLTTPEMLHLDVDTYVNLSGGVAMDAADYRGQTAFDVLNDCALASGKNFWAMFIESGGAGGGDFGLWYDFESSTAYPSDILISNVIADVDHIFVFEASFDSELTRDPHRVYSGVYMPFDGGAVFRERTATGDDFQYRDTTAYSENVKTTAKANARADRMLEDIATEEDRITTTVILPNAKVNALKEGHRVQCKFSHLPGYEDYRWLRVLNRTVTRQEGGEFYSIALELSGPGSPGTGPSQVCIANDDVSYPFTPAGTHTGLGPPVLVGGNWEYTSTDFLCYMSAPTSASDYPLAGQVGNWGNGGVGNCVYTSGGVDYGAGGLNRYITINVIGPGTLSVETTPALGPCTNGGAIDANAYVSGIVAAAIDSDSGVPGDTLTVTIPDGDECAHYVRITGVPGNGEFGFVSATWTPA